MSPTLFKIGNLRIVIYPNDHNPPHVHVIGPEGEAKFELKTLKCFFVKNFSKRDVRRMQEFLLERRELLLEMWNDYQA